MNTRQRLRTASLVLVLAAFAAPVAYALLGSLQPEEKLFAPGLPSPSALTLVHYRALAAQGSLWSALQSSLIVASATTALCLALGAPCAYALARLRFAARLPILVFVLAVSMFPQISVVPPLYLVLRELGLIDTYPGLVLPYLTFAMPLTVWLLFGFFRKLPRELEEAALVDGARPSRIMLEVVAPLSAPALATTAVLTFIYCWNEFLFALSFTLEHNTVPVAIALLQGRYQMPWGEVLAASVLSTVPVAVLVLAFQRRIVHGLTSGAVKG